MTDNAGTVDNDIINLEKIKALTPKQILADFYSRDLKLFRLEEEVSELRRSVKWYKARCDLLDEKLTKATERLNDATHTHNRSITDNNRNSNAKELVKKFFITIDIDKDDWENDLKNLLNKPFEEIMEIWKSKQIYRDQYDNEWLIGMKLHAGKLGAKYIKKFMIENTKK